MSRQRSQHGGTGRPTGRLVALTAAASLALAPVLAGCGRGLAAETSRERVLQDAVNAAARSVKLLNVFVEAPPVDAYPAGADARVRLLLFNSAPTDDALIAVSTPAAMSVEIQRVSPGTVVPEAVSSVALPAGNQQSTEAGDFSVVLRGLSAQLRAGSSIPMTFSFENAGSVTVKIPVQSSA